MSKRNIAEFSAVVIFAAAFSTFLGACGYVSSGERTRSFASPYLPPKVVGNIRSSEITEASGLAASRCQDNILWTHNDSGDNNYIFAVSTAGKFLGTFKVTGAENIDWEDIAATKDASGKCWLFIGEIGDNKQRRHEHAIYRVVEPLVALSDEPATRKNAPETAGAERVIFAYPDYNQDAETLLVHPTTGDIYVVTKRVSGPAGVYRIKPRFGDSTPQTAEKVAEIAVPAIPNGLLTGGDISPQGDRVILTDYSRAHELSLPAGASFDEIWKEAPVAVEVGRRDNGEAICYSVDGTVLYATSEKKNPPLIEIRRK